MAPKNRPPTHPGEILYEDFLEPLGLSQKQFSEHLGVCALYVAKKSNAEIAPSLQSIIEKFLDYLKEQNMNLNAIPEKHFIDSYEKHVARAHPRV